MSLTLADVERIAHLARIHLSADEADRALGHLNGIFTMIEQINAVDTDGLEPMAHALDGAQRLRDDVVSEQIDREQTMKNAPARADGLFLVPRVIE
ncbi:Asp-tRNA(Asn)/Glu-tRNA(Gln) amidotransferase subunit GatC [soil metagenome]